MNAKKKILCFGDSNTWGFKPVGALGHYEGRYGESERWPCVMQYVLGTAYEVIEDGMCGRCTGSADVTNSTAWGAESTFPKDCAAASPLSLIIIMLGTNDLSNSQHKSIQDIAAGIKSLLSAVQQLDNAEAVQCLVVAPVPLRQGENTVYNSRFSGAWERSRKLAAAYKKVTDEFHNAHFFDASEVTPVADGCDGLHLSARTQQKLGRALATRILTFNLS